MNDWDRERTERKVNMKKIYNSIKNQAMNS